MTKDLMALSTIEGRHTVNSEDFLDAIAKNLDAKLA